MLVPTSFVPFSYPIELVVVGLFGLATTNVLLSCERILGWSRTTSQ